VRLKRHTDGFDVKVRPPDEPAKTIEYSYEFKDDVDSWLDSIKSRKKEKSQLIRKGRD